MTTVSIEVGQRWRSPRWGTLVPLDGLIEILEGMRND